MCKVGNWKGEIAKKGKPKQEKKCFFSSGPKNKKKPKTNEQTNQKEKENQNEEENKAKEKDQMDPDPGDYYDDIVDHMDVATYTMFGKRRKITAEERDELKRKCDEMAAECVARNKRGIACEDERRRCKRRVYARWFYAPTFHERLDHFLYTADERAERTEKAKEARNQRLREREKREAREESEAKKEASEAKKAASEAKRKTIQWASDLRRAREERSNASSQAKRTGRPERPERPGRTEGPVKTDEKRTGRPEGPVNSAEEKRALRMLKLFLERAGASMGTIDVKLLTELEREFMPTVRARVPSARLVGVPDGIGDEWPTYVYLYCLYLVAVGSLSTNSKAHGVTTLFVSVPGPSGPSVLSGPKGPSVPNGPKGPNGPSGLRVCLLRFDREGRVSLSY